MDLDFLKLWSDAVRHSAAMQTLADEIRRWTKGDIRQSDELYRLFQKYYGQAQGTDGFNESKDPLKNLAENFQKTFKELLEMWGVVPRSEYDDLRKKYDDLKKKVAALETALKDLEKKLGGGAPGQINGADVFDDMIKTQSAQFQKIMNAFADISGITASIDEKK